MPSHTVDDIRISAQTISGIEIDARVNLLWCCACISDIVSKYPLAARYVKEDFRIENKGDGYTPQREIVLVDKVLVNQKEKLSRTADYEIVGQELIFNEIGDYQVRYYGMPDMPQVYADTIDMPSQFVDAMRFFVAGRIRARLFGQNDQNAVSFYQEYTNGILSADNFMRSRDRRSRRMPPAYRGV